MTESDKPGNSGADVPPPSAGSPPPYSSPAGQYPPPPPDPYPYADMSAPFGRHPVTGEPLADKSKIAAGLLQLVGLLGVVGIGRMYIGHTGLGIAQRDRHSDRGYRRGGVGDRRRGADPHRQGA